MTKSYLFTTIFLLISTAIWAQATAAENNMQKEFFTTENFKFATALGVDAALYHGAHGSLSREQMDASNAESTSLSLGLDFYSPQSTLGFFIDPTYSIQNFNIVQENAPLRDSISMSSLEIPFYLKLRMGNPLKQTQWWLAAGGGYSIPLSVEQFYYDNNSNATIIQAAREEKDMFNSIPYLSAIFGLDYTLAFGESDKEMFQRDAARLLVYVKANYDLGNRINQDFNSGFNTSLGNIPNPDLKMLRVSIGARIILRLSKVAQFTSEVGKAVLQAQQ